MNTYTVEVTKGIYNSGGGILNGPDATVTVKARNRSAAEMAARTELEREAAAKGEPTSFALTFHRVTRHGDKRPWLRLSGGSGWRGADMGRGGAIPTDVNAPLVMFLHRVRLDSGGYDEGGAYWGYGAPLYRAVSNDEVPVKVWYGEPITRHAEVFVRALSREDAKREVRVRIPGATFFR